MNGFNAIPVFVTVVESGSFSRAANTLGISKSAVSKRITQLETQLGLKLIQRSTRKLSLTEAGEHYFEHAAKAYRAGRDAEDAVTQLQGDPQGRLRISTPMSFGRLHMAPLVPEFLKRYPKVSIDLVMDDKVADLVGGGFDVAIRAGELPDSTLIARRLAPLHSVLCASPAYIEKQGRPRTPAELEHHNCLLFSYSAVINEWTFRNHQGSDTVEISGNYQANNSEALLEAMLRGTGVGRLPTFVAGPHIKAGHLINLLESYRMPSQTIHAVFPQRQYMPAKVRVFLDFSVEFFGGETPYWDA